MRGDSLFAQPEFCSGGWPVPVDDPVRLCGCDQCACCGRGLDNGEECGSTMYAQGCRLAGWDSARPGGLVAERDGVRVEVETAFTGVVKTTAGYAWTHDRFCPPCVLRAHSAADARRAGMVPYDTFQNATLGDTFKADGVGRWPEVLDDPKITPEEVRERRYASGAGGGAGDRDVGRRGRR